MLDRRLQKEMGLAAHTAHQGHGLFSINRYVDLDRWGTRFLKAARLYERGRRNLGEIELNEQTWIFGNLPREFDGFRILHISDLHCDIDVGISERLSNRVREVDCDLVVMTGDYQDTVRRVAEDELTKCFGLLRESLEKDVLFVLGNHDYHEVFRMAEAAGFLGLANDVARVSKGDAEILVAGLDDPHFYQTHDFSAFGDDVRVSFSILLSHSPEVYRDASEKGFDLLLSGHTHGGQICLPGGIPLVGGADIARWGYSGRWEWNGMGGYTSRGVGASGIPVRFNCPPEICLHRLFRDGGAGGEEMVPSAL